MKLNLKTLVFRALVLTSTLVFTSCEGALDDIFGEWSRPTPGGGSTVSVTGISLDQTTLSMQVGDADVTLTAKVAPDNATDKTVTWSSDNEAAATVTDGVVHAVAMGTAIITAKAGDKKATCTVTVTLGLATPLTVEAITQGKITVTSPKSGMKYSKDGGVTKLPVSANPTNIPVAAGEKVAFYGTDPSVTNYHGTYIYGTDDGGTFKCKVYGNIMSLLFEDFATNYNTLPANNTFRSLFNGNTKLTDASGLLLPAMTLAGYCYYQMFYNCTNLAAAPKELPATTLDDCCYYLMFYGCKALTETPKLPAETVNLADNCYESMFQNCTSLTTAYVKAAYDSYHNRCYMMFNGCTAAGTKTLHTTTASKTSWDGVMPSTWAGWTAVDDWTD